MNHLFVYGTLMDAGLVEQLTGKIFKCIKAALNGYKLYRVKNETYPAIVRKNNAIVNGLLLWKVDDKSMEIFIAYEGIQYKTEQVSVVAGDKTIKSLVFVWDDEFDLLTDQI